jgi:hypothetical protein
MGAAGRWSHKGGNSTGILDLEPGLNQDILKSETRNNDVNESSQRAMTSLNQIGYDVIGVTQTRIKVRSEDNEDGS